LLTSAAAREAIEEQEANERRRLRREKHERHKRERNGDVEHEPRERSERDRAEKSERRRRHRSERDRDSNSESDSGDEQDYVEDKPKMLEAPKKKGGFEEPVMSGGLGDVRGFGEEEKRDPLGLTNMSNLRENPYVPGQYIGYVRNPPTPAALVGGKK
jgi:hypothetical protein